MKYPGKITVSIGPAIPTKNRKYTDVLAEAEHWVHQETRRLVEKGLQQQTPAQKEMSSWLY
jgi:hypothetical protein